uniref:Doublecortin domain-containing protein 1 n=1 Tax=Hydra vulgaris TaxID=6087 RepID=T2MEH7_HYDVU
MNTSVGSTLPRRPASSKPYISNFRQAINQDAVIARYLEEFAKKGKSDKKINSDKSVLFMNSPYAAPSHTDNELFKGNKKYAPNPPKKGRPISAPVYKIGTGNWNAFDDSPSSMASSMNSNVSSLLKTPLYKRPRPTLCVQAAVNGSQKFFRVTAPNLSKLFMECTRKLCLPSSARKLFLSDGTLVVHESQLTKDCEVFVSTGEPFKDLYLSLQEREKLRKASFWTVNGIFLPNSSINNKTKHTSLSARMKDIADFQKRRVLVFKNGLSSNGAEIVTNTMDDFLDMCTTRLGLTSGARYLFNWNGELVEDLSQATIKTLHAEESEVSPSAHKFQHISEISSDNRLINGLQCFRIFIYPNGQKCEEKLVVNIRELLKGTKTKAEEMQRFFDFVNSNSNVIKMFEMDIRMVSVKRAFLIGGEEITSLSMLSQDAKIWLTLGEDFIPIQSSAKLASAKSLYRVCHFLTQDSIHLYKSQISLCMDVLGYCCHIWGRSSNNALSFLDKMQKRIVNIIGRALAANLQPLSHHCNVASLSLFYKYYNRHCSKELASLVPSTKIHSCVTHYSIKSHPTVTVPKCYKNSYSSSFFPQTSVL